MSRAVYPRNASEQFRFIVPFDRIDTDHSRGIGYRVSGLILKRKDYTVADAVYGISVIMRVDCYGSIIETQVGNRVLDSDGIRIR